ncbi:acyl-CoA N-acyltransferase [Endogone sp. FLAS-F59071]|nr:acyl-CoA N-acyltransferase [Endogone sp. FLAS-F59071]|eukprot:RUS15808.1 acyl-CoA N-acyltransferase [Endogone sp. FLAS-F59071]
MPFATTDFQQQVPKEQTDSGLTPLLLIPRVPTQDDFDTILEMRRITGWDQDLVPKWFELQEQGLRYQWLFSQPSQPDVPIAMVALDLIDYFWHKDRDVASREDGRVCITSLNIAPACRGKGYGTWIVRWVEEQARELLGEQLKHFTMHTWYQNETSINMFSKLGYVKFKEQPRYYEEGGEIDNRVIAVFMEKRV